MFVFYKIYCYIRTMEVLTVMKKKQEKVTNPMADNLPERLRMCREAAGLSLREVASRIKKSAASVCKWENGEVTPYGETLLALCEIYKVDITTFFGLPAQSKIRITPYEIELVKLYRNATKEAQKTIHMVLENCQKTI